MHWYEDTQCDICNIGIYQSQVQIEGFVRVGTVCVQISAFEKIAFLKLKVLVTLNNDKFNGMIVVD